MAPGLGHDAPPQEWHEDWSCDVEPAWTTTDAMEECYRETALLRRLCRSMKAAIQPCRSNEGFDARFDRQGDNYKDTWERLANFENDAIVALARAGRDQ